MRMFSETWRGNQNYSRRTGKQNGRTAKTIVLIVSILGLPLNKRKVWFDSWIDGTNWRVCSQMLSAPSQANSLFLVTELISETRAKGTNTQVDGLSTVLPANWWVLSCIEWQSVSQSVGQSCPRPPSSCCVDAELIALEPSPHLHVSLIFGPGCGDPTTTSLIWSEDPSAGHSLIKCIEDKGP